MYITSFRLSRTFFESFSTSGPLCISSNFLSLPHSGSFVKNFFQKFLNFRFPLICGNFLSLPHRAVAVKCFFLFTLWRSAYRADSFVRIPNHSAFVNTIFQLSSLFLFFPVFSRLLLCHTYVFSELPFIYRKSAGFPAPFLSQQQRLQLFSTERSIYRLRDLCEVCNQRAGLEHRVVLSKRNKVVMFTHQ